MTGMIDRGELHRLTLRFLDPELEDIFQKEEGAAGLVGYRIITGAMVLLWSAAAFLVPLGTDISSRLALTAGGLMALAGSFCFVATGRVTTMNRQHGLGSVLTSANGLVILFLAESGDTVEGYAVGAFMLLFLFGFVSRTRFVYAVVRTVVIAAGFAVAVAVYDGPGSLLVDSFVFVAAAVASILGLRLGERNRREAWHQRLVIEDQAATIEAEKAESDRLLLNVLPPSVSQRLKDGENPIADDFPSVSVIFADIVGFTPMSSTMTAAQVITMLSGLFSHFDDLVTARNLEKIKTIGDAYMAVGGLPEPLDRHAERIIDLALAMLEATRSSGPFPELALRIGVHSGPVAGGVIGSRKFAYDIWGTTVNIVARLQQAGIPGRVQVSERTKDLADMRFRFEPRGSIQLRGLGTMNAYLVVDADVAPSVAQLRPSRH